MIHRTNMYPSKIMKQRSVHFVQGINLRKSNQQIIIKMNHQQGDVLENVINLIVTRAVSGKISKYWNIYTVGFML